MTKKDKHRSHAGRKLAAGLRIRKIGARSTNSRDLKKYCVIYTEGQKTEPFYFKGLKEELIRDSLRIIEIDVFGVGRVTTSLVEYAHIDVQKNFLFLDPASVFIVFDKDSFADKQFNEAILLCDKYGYNAIWSNEAFELWYILHFEYLQSALSRDEYNQKIEKALQQRGVKGYKYKKNDINMYETLGNYGEQKTAIKNAKKLMKLHQDKTSYAEWNPATRVFELVENLNGLIEKGE